MQPTPITLTLTPALAAAAGQLIETGAKTIGAQSWAQALELLQAIQQAMQTAAQEDQRRIAELHAKATEPEPAP